MTEPADSGAPPVMHAEYCRRKAAQLRRLAALPHAPYDRGTLIELATKLQAAADAIEGNPQMAADAAIVPGRP